MIVLRKEKKDMEYSKIEFSSNESKEVNNGLRWLACYPDKYVYAQIAIGYQYFVHNLELVGFKVERIYIDNNNLENIEIDKFDYISFSISYEPLYIEVIKMMKRMKIEPDRHKRDRIGSILVAGGFSINYNPVPLENIFDVFCIGDSELMVSSFILRNQNKGKTEKLSELAMQPGIFVSGHSNFVQKQKLLSINTDYIPSIIDWKSVYKGAENGISMEHIRGCANSCRFCILSYSNKKPIVRSLENCIEFMKKIKSKCNKIKLVSASDCENPFIDELYTSAEQLGITLCIGSQRIDKMSSKTIKSAKKNQKRISIAPETGSDRLRRVINKNIINQNIYDSLGKMKDVEEINMFLMLGIPTETYKDIDDTVFFLQKVRVILPHSILSIGINCMIPKPFTPFQWAEQILPEEYIQRLKYLLYQIKNIRNIKFTIMEPLDAFVQGVISRSDERMGAVLIEMSTVENTIENWRKVLNKNGLCDKDLFKEKNKSEKFAWDKIQGFVRKEILFSEWIMSQREIISNGECSLKKCISGCKCIFAK